MDQEINELKELVRQNIALAQDNNKILHAMRRNARIKSIIWFAFILFSAGTFAWFFLTYLAPYLQQLVDLYNTAQQSIQALQNMGPGR